MKLKKLLSSIKTKTIIGSVDVDITDIHTDSRNIRPASLFVAVPGTLTDGHNYIDAAIQRGAIAIVCNQVPTYRDENTTYIQVNDSEGCVGKLAATFYGNPTQKMKLVGVTGTNGKTTIATLLYLLFRSLGHKVGLLSTVCNYIDNEAIASTHTTPDPITTNKLMAQMVENGCEYVFMEVSSHAVAQQRIVGLCFAGGIFTNLTRDHLDYHKSMENYLKAKKAFFDGLDKKAFALVNIDDKNGIIMAQNTQAKVYTYSLRNICDFKGKILENSFEGMLMDINNCEVNMQFTGRFNALNLLAVYGAARLLGKESAEILVNMSTLHPVTGRFDTIHSLQGFTAIVDYAHTPDALVNVLNTIREVQSGKGQIITVIGAGGNRDTGKRPLMAQASMRYSHKVIFTSDNPRFEDPQAIIDDMIAGLTSSEMKNALCIIDRKEAIRTACMMAQKGDVILVAGKGHESYQEIKGEKKHFNDKEIIQDILTTQC